jgi:Protein of unknwon function (DUF3310).
MTSYYEDTSVDDFLKKAGYPMNDKAYESSADYFIDSDITSFSELGVITELEEYIISTYSQHYTNDNNNIQALDVWQARGTMTSSCIDTTIKYLMRYGKKDGSNRKDLLKAAHYIILALGNERDKNQED